MTHFLPTAAIELNNFTMKVGWVRLCVFPLNAFFFLDNGPFTALVSFLAKFYCVVCFPVRCFSIWLPTSHPSEDARMARRQQNRTAQDWAIGRKILDRAEKSVTQCNVDSPETKRSVVNQSKGSTWRTGSSWITNKISHTSRRRDFLCLFS